MLAVRYIFFSIFLSLKLYKFLSKSSSTNSGTRRAKSYENDICTMIEDVRVYAKGTGA